MAKIVERFICPVCKRYSDTPEEAIKCRNSHAPIKELWAESKSGKACLVAYYGEERALFEAELPDNIDARKQKLAEWINKDPEKCRRLGYTLNS